MWMCDGRQRDEWIHTAYLLCTIINSNRHPEAPPARFDEIYPFAKKKKLIEAPEDPADHAAYMELVRSACDRANSGRGA